MNDLIKVNIKTLVATREPVPDFLLGGGFLRESLINLQQALTGQQLIEYGIVDIEFWPPSQVPQSPAWNKKLTDEILDPDPATKTVNVSQTIESKTAAEIQADRNAMKLQVYNVKTNKLATPLLMSNGMSIDPMAGLSIIGHARGNPKASRNFTARNGSFAMNIGQVDVLNVELDDYVQSFEDRGTVLNGLIDAANSQAKWDAIDINSGWPI